MTLPQPSTGHDRTQLDYPFKQMPDAGQALEIHPGIYWLRMPLPFKPDHINIWLLQDSKGWTLIDTGFYSDETRQIWLQFFEDLLAGQPIQRIILTHHHYDHIGLASWLSQQFDAPIYTSQTEYDLMTGQAETLENEEEQHIKSYYQMHGAPEVADMYLGFRHKSIMAQIPLAHHPLSHHESLQIGEYNWQVILCGGHTPGQALLYCKALNVLISGDQVLPTISSNVGLWCYTKNVNPLGSYLDSLQTLLAETADPLLLPSHGNPCYGLAMRIGALTDEHHQQLQTVLDSCQQAQTVAQLQKRLFPKVQPGVGQALAFAETQACVTYLQEKNLLSCNKNNDGIYHYQAVH